MRVIREVLTDGWRFRDRSVPDTPTVANLPWLPATVPGHVHLDLAREGVIPDPFRRMYERDVQWVDRTAWIYALTLSLDAARLAASGDGRHFLEFEGLDTIAAVFVNGQLAGRAENMFVPHRLDVTGLLREGENEVRVEFEPALVVGQERARSYLGDGTSERGSQGYFNFGPRAFVRKAQYMFGWDWGPELVSCGIWQPVRLVTVSVAELRDWRFAYELDDSGSATARLTIDIASYSPPADLSVEAELAGIRAVRVQEVPATEPNPTGSRRFELSWPAVAVERWDPESPRLYPLEIRLRSGTDLVDSLTSQVGFRTVELVQQPDAAGGGTGFRLRINGRDTFVKGANWIPDHSFPGVITEAQLRERLTQAKAAGFNMLRVWGGGLFESEAFYRLCDELGLLVWQDFPFACSMYPDDEEWFADAVRAEAAAVRRIRNHPSLALWCGGNENLQLAEQRWDKEKQARRFYGDRLIHQVIPEILAAEDPATPYWPNSPYGGTPSNSETSGDSHYWDVWHGRGDWIHYRDSTSRFSSEFGFASSCGLAAWREVMEERDRSPYSAVARWHDKTRKGYETYLGYVELHFPRPESIEDLVYYSQANQAEALRFGVSHWRRHKGHCWGTLIWQLNDCWPVQSWAMVDSKGEPKAAWYAARRFYAPLLLSLVRDNAEVHAHLVNDRHEPIPGRLQWTLSTFTGETIASASCDVTAPANAAARVAALSLEQAAGRGRELFLFATFQPEDGGDAVDDLLFFAEPKELDLPVPQLSCVMGGDEASLSSVTLSAQAFAPYVWIHRADHDVLHGLEENFFHLRPGESRTIHFDPIQAAKGTWRDLLCVRSLWGPANLQEPTP